MNSTATTNSPGRPRATGRYAIYARKSQESEDRQVQSIDDQVRLCREMARERGHQVVRVIEEARSAKAQGTRPGYRELIGLIERGEADGVLAWHPDRLARNAVDGGWVLDLLDRGRIKGLSFVSYTFEDTPEGKFMLGMIFSQSKYYVDKLAKDVRRGLDSKRDKGQYPHRAPEGYLNNVVDKTIEADPERFPLLRQAVELVLQRVLLPSQVLAKLNGQWGYRTRRTKRSKGGPLSRTSFYDLLSSPFYYGECREKGRVYPGAHPPLISREEFEEIQRILGRPEKPKAQKHAFALTGLIRCGRCGSMITATISKGHVYYHCTNRRGDCTKAGVRAEVLEGQVRERLARLAVPAFLEPLLLGMVERFFAETYGRGRQVEESRHRALEEAQRQMQGLVSMRLRELLTDAEYLEQKQRLQEQIDGLRREIDAAEHVMEQALETAENVIHYAAWAGRAFAEGGPEERRQIAGLLGSRFVLTEGNLLLEPNPYLAPFAQDHAELAGFKPPESGPGSAKRTDAEAPVPLGCPSGTAFKLGGLIARYEEYFPPLPFGPTLPGLS
ncbi:MAG: recombinase family protein [Armatimonadetes bacterium]|nr:recombinase family protein [Armatimonadota bacterium]